MSLLFGVAALVFGLIDLSGIVAQLDDAPRWWTVCALLAVPGAAAVLGIAAPFAAVRVLRRLAAATAIGYLLVAASMPFAVERVATAGAAPWPLGLTAVGTTAAALAFRPAVAWTATGLLGVSVAVDRVTTTDVDLTAIALQDAAYATFFAAVFTALTLAALAAARRVDEAAAAADRAAQAAEVARVRDAERVRVDAVVHDRVLATLLLAARSPRRGATALPAQAVAALDGLLAMTRPADPRSPVGPEELSARLRERVVALAPDAVLEVAAGGESEVPAPAADALLDAADEAVRNALRHAGPSATITVRLGSSARDTVVTVSDDGRGFDAVAVVGRLGITRSIDGRMRAAGGASEIESAPGAGTVVRLSWPAS